MVLDRQEVNIHARKNTGVCTKVGKSKRHRPHCRMAGRNLDPIKLPPYVDVCFPIQNKNERRKKSNGLQLIISENIDCTSSAYAY
jgi:hypothetical protein